MVSDDEDITKYIIASNKLCIGYSMKVLNFWPFNKIQTGITKNSNISYYNL